MYVKFGGNSILFGLNYGRILNQKEILKFSGSVGLSYIPQGNIKWTPVVPIELTVFYGKSRHNLKIGARTTFYTSQQTSLNPDTNRLQENVSLDVMLPFRLGYRFQKPEGGFFYRIGYTPGIFLSLNSQDSALFFPLSGGISFGKSF